MVTRDEFESATRKAKKRETSSVRAISARYDRRIGRVVIQLNSNLEIAFSPHDAEGLADATPAELNPVEVSPSGFGIYFPKLDVDLYLPALMEGILGSKRWMASRLGAEGGRSKSAAKAHASRINGRLGGRPRNTIAR